MQEFFENVNKKEIYKLVYLVYLLLWILTNFVLLFPPVTNAIYSGKPFSFQTLLVTEFIATIIFSVLIPDNIKYSSHIMNGLGILYTIFLFPMFIVVRILILLYLIYNLWNFFKDNYIDFNDEIEEEEVE